MVSVGVWVYVYLRAFLCVGRRDFLWVVVYFLEFVFCFLWRSAFGDGWFWSGCFVFRELVFLFN